MASKTIEKSMPNVYSGAVKRTCTIMENQDVSSKVGNLGPIESVAEISLRPNRPGPDAAETNPFMFEPIDTAQFWTRVKGAGVHDCWEWDARSNQAGYGRFRGEMAHRVAYQLVNGEIPGGLLIRHVCDNPRCCNPQHLLVGTHQDNADDAVERNRLSRGERHPKTKLTAEQVAIIRANPDRMSGRALGTRYGVAESTISYIRNGRSWKL